MKYILMLMAVMILAISLPAAEGNEIENKGSQRIADAQLLGEKCRNFSTNINLTMEIANGQHRNYRMRLSIKKDEDNCEKKLFVVDAPLHLKGTALLIHSHEDKQNEQWLYLSSRKRIKKIYPCFQSSNFLNTEWTYEDMGGYSINQYSTTLVREDTLLGKTYMVIAAMPMANLHSGYSRQLRWVDAETDQLYKIEYYDQNNTLLKTLTIEQYQQYANRYWYMKRMVVENHKNGKTMTLTFSKCRDDIKLDTRQFSEDCFYKSKANEGGTFCLAQE